MGIYKNFKSVVYCVAQWADKVTKDELENQIKWMQKYIGVDKVYLETYRGDYASKEQICMIKQTFEKEGIEVSGGITTVTPNLTEEDKKRHRLFETFCYSNEAMRNRLKEVSEYTASLFDEFIIDDFFFTQCMCENCLREKGNSSWKDFRLSKMMEVSEKLVIEPAKKVNPNVKIIIKYPNWRESFQETGYNPEFQRTIFDGIYTGTETRHGAQQDQHLPRYLSYSLPIYMENVAPNRNGGGWFDPFDCDRIDSYLEQAYLTAFSKSKEIMHFCWSAVYNNKRATPLGLQYERIDRILSECENPIGLPVYIPFNSQGEDHIEDYLGMIGIPMNPTPDFPTFQIDGNTAQNSPAVLVTASSLYDKEIYKKVQNFMKAGGKVIATSGFMMGALESAKSNAQKDDFSNINIHEFTSIRYNGKTLYADEFQVASKMTYGMQYIKTASEISFPLLEHRNNSTWSKANAGHGEYHESIIMFDTYSNGIFEVINLPQMPSKIKDLPSEVLTAIRTELLGSSKVYVDSSYGVSLFTYSNNTFGIYCYTNDGCAPMEFNIIIKEKIELLKMMTGETNQRLPSEIKPLYIKEPDYWNKETESVFRVRIIPGEFLFFKF